LATRGKLDGSCQEPSAKGNEPDNQRERTFPDDAGHDDSASGAGAVSHDIATSTPIEDRLRAQEAFYGNIIEGAADVTTLISSDGTILYASAAIAEPTSLGYSPREVIGRNSLDLMHPDDRERVVGAMANVFAGVATTIDARLRKKDGSWLWVEMRGRQIAEPDGKLVAVVQSRDVNNRKALEEQLQANEEYYRSILHGSSDLLTIADQSGAIRFTSDSVQRILGYPPEEVLGQPLFSFIHPEDFALSVERLSKAAEAPNVLTELRVRRKDGTWCECEGTGRRINGPHSEPLILINTRDISARKRAEREMRELATIVNNSNEVIVGFSPDFKITSWNTGAARAFGVPASAAIGRGFDLFIPPDKLPRVIEVEKQVLDTGRNATLEVSWPKPDGSLRSWLVNFFPLRDSDGKVVGGGSIGHDISERKHTEREQALLAALVKSSEDGIVSVATDARISSWNAGAEKLFGYTGEEAIGQNLADLLIPSELRERAKAGVQREFTSTAQGHSLSVHHLDVPALRKDGSTVEVTVSVSGIYDSAGKLLGASSIVRDITERKRAEREQALLAAVVRSSADAIVSYSRDLLLTSWNRGAERMLGFTATEAIGKSILDVYVPARRREHAQTVMSEVFAALVAKPNASRRLEAPIVRKDGVEVEVAIMLSGIYNRAGQLLGLSAIISDLTERKQAEHEQALLASIVMSIDDGVLSVTPTGIITSANPGTEVLTGFTAAEIIGQSPTILLPPESRDAIEKEMMRQVAGAREHRPFSRFETRIQRKDRTLRDVSIAASGIYDAGRALIGVSVIMHDFTEQNQADRERATLGAIVNASEDAIVSSALDNRILTWNKGAERLFGVVAGAAIGQEMLNFVVPDELGHVTEVIGGIVRDRRGRSFRVRSRKGDGTLFETWLNLFPIFDKAGEIAAIGGIGRDITDLIKLEGQQVLLASLVNASDDAILAVDRELRITGWNPGAERVYGFGAKEALGHSLDLFVAPEELHQQQAIYQRVLETGKPEGFERHEHGKDGRPHIALVNAFPIRDATGNISGVGGIGRDITKLKEIELELREAHEYTRGLIDSSIDAMVVVDGEMRIIDGNEQLAKLTEVPKKVLLGSSFHGYFADPAAAQSAIKKTFADGFITNVELVVMAASGKEIPVSFNASLFYRAGRVFGIFGVARDVTRQRAIERTLRQEREYSRSLVQSSPDSLLVCNSDLVLTDANEQAVVLTGYAREELIGIRLPSLFTKAASAQELLEKTSQQGRVHEVELQLLTRTAREIPVSLNAAAFTESDGPGRRIVAVVRDISERERAEKERSLLASIVESSGNAIYSEASDLTMTSWNPAAEKLFGYSAPEAIGRSAVLLAPLDCRGDLLRHAHSVRLSGKPENFETRRLRKDGSVIDVAITQSPILDPSGAVVALSVTAQDISDRRRMEADLAQARDAALEGARLKSEFLANMSHEIRTPLNSVIGMTGLLLDTELNAEQREFAHDVRESGDALLSLINNILDYSKISAGKLVLEEVDFELGGAIEGALELLAEPARSKGLELTSSLDPDVPRYLRGDPGRLRQVLVNLLSNAIKFTERGEVGIGVSKLSENPQESTLRFEVRDSGIGIAKEKLHLLFQAFTQVDASTTRHYGGTGLGLSIARELVQAMHGTIAVSSTPGVGSTFWFTVKVGKQVDPSKPASERFASLTGTRILIVDDNANSRQILEHQLAAWGMLPRTASSAQEALAILSAAPRAEAFQMALLDVMMPEMDGIELARRIKADPALAKVVVVFASSVGTRSDFSVRLLGLDIGGWLMKPVPESSLYNTLVKALASVSDTAVDSAMAPREKLGAQPPSSAVKFKLSPERKLKVLLAEDNPINQKVATLQLRKLGIEVDTVANGRKAVEASSRQPYDLILMDCQMPEMDGYDATREIRRRESSGRKTVIVAMTAHALPGDREKCLAAGMDSYISKPVTQAVLEATLAELFAAKPAPATTADAAPAPQKLGVDDPVAPLAAQSRPDPQPGEPATSGVHRQK
jgi:two-component system, sensor histidine kinase and response regulator